MPNSRGTLKPAYSLGRKHIAYQPHPLAAVDVSVPGSRYPRALLPPVLQGKKPVIHKRRHVPAGILAEYTEYAAFFTQFIFFPHIPLTSGLNLTHRIQKI
jgi:hypothetical protein